jgi:hypothetical protein
MFYYFLLFLYVFVALSVYESCHDDYCYDYDDEQEGFVYGSDSYKLDFKLYIV